MSSESEQSADEFPSKSHSGAETASDSENSEISGDNHDDNTHQHNGTCSDTDPSTVERKETQRISSESAISASDLDNDSDCGKNKTAKNDAHGKSKTKEMEKEEEEKVEEVVSENRKSEEKSSEEENNVESESKCVTPRPKINMVPMAQLLNTVARKAEEKQSKLKKSKDDSVFSISSDDSDHCKPSTSRNALKKQISTIVTTMDMSSDSEDEAPLRSKSSSRPENIKSVRPVRRAATKAAVVDLSGESEDSDSSSITPNYCVEQRKIGMLNCGLTKFQSAEVKLGQMNLPKLLEKHHLSEIRNHRQKIVVRRKSDGETEICDQNELNVGKKSRIKPKDRPRPKQAKNSSKTETKKKNSDTDTSDESNDGKKSKKPMAKERPKRNRGVIKSSDDDGDKANAGHKTSSSDSESDVAVQRSKRKKAKDSDSGDFKPNGAKSDSDSVDFKPKRSKIVRRSAKRDSDASGSQSDGSRKPKKVRRKRIKRNSESSSNDDEAKETSSPTKGRKNIKKIIKVRDLDEETRLAAKEEAMRKKRIEERQKLYNLSFNSKLEEEGELKELVLDFDIETKEPLISVDEKLVKKLKPHQTDGIKFMFDACFESVEKINEEDSKGGGCILAHCMGLGKTLQVVALTHTLLSHSDETKVERVLVICPVSTVLNWVNEFKIWLKHCKSNKDIEIFELSKCKKDFERAYKITDWFNDGGVLIIGYDMFRNLSAEKGKKGGRKGGKKIRNQYLNGLIDPGPDLVICDEGHLLKNSKTALSQAVTRIRTLRRIVLTGTPLQNNLNEYYCMVQFVKPNLLGKYNEYLNRFVNPITNGQYHDSSSFDIQMMKRRSHILHKLLDGCVQRRDYSVLSPFLPPKHEFVLSIRLTPMQKLLYKYYIENRPVQVNDEGKTRSTKVFQDFQNLQRIWTHPLALRYNSDRFEESEQKRREAMSEDEDEGSLKDFIDDDDDDDESNSGSGSSDEDAAPVQQTLRRTRAMRANDREPEPEPEPEVEKRANPTEWWMSLCPDEELNNLEHSGKLQVFFSILKECEAIGDKVLVFSQSLYSLDVIEQFLSLIDDNTQIPHADAKLCGYNGSWSPGLDYFRLDGSTPIEARNTDCKSFNSVVNPRARLYLISTRAGGLGINLVAANRVIIFDVSWNPSHDIQSIFRVYRFGQMKPCYIYRFLAMGTMEEKIYERQVTKLAISKRVIDEQQIDRHYKAKDLNELYMTNLDVDEERPPVALPKDLLFAEQLRKFDKLIYKYHEQDSLLENKEEETLSKEEIDAAWEEYEQEKTRKPIVQQNFVPQNFVPQQFPRAGAAGSTIYGIPTEIMLQLLGVIYKTGNPGATMTTINQNVPGLLNYLYESMGKGDTSFFNSLVRMYYQMIPDAAPLPNVFLNPNPGMMNGVMPNQGLMNGGMAYSVQNNTPSTAASATQRFVQQAAPTATNLNSVIEID